MLICQREGCGVERDGHEKQAPHGTNTIPGCAGYMPAHPCGNCGTDVELHDAEQPHPRYLVSGLLCEGVATEWREPTFEGGGGSSGGGGASGTW